VTCFSVHELARDRKDPPRIVFASTGAVYGNRPAIAQREDDPVNAENPYAASKLAAEELIRHHAKSGRSAAIILRLSNIAGGVANIYDDDGGHLIPRVLKAIRDGTQITVNGDGRATRDYVHVSDAAEAVRLAY
jgi:UDP-glucose 4-epimerase